MPPEEPGSSIMIVHPAWFFIVFLKRVIEKSLGPTCNVKQRIKKKSLVKLSWWMGALKMEKFVRAFM